MVGVSLGVGVSVGVEVGGTNWVKVALGVQVMVIVGVCVADGKTMGVCEGRGVELGKACTAVTVTVGVAVTDRFATWPTSSIISPRQ